MRSSTLGENCENPDCDCKQAGVADGDCLDELGPAVVHGFDLSSSAHLKGILTARGLRTGLIGSPSLEALRKGLRTGLRGVCRARGLRRLTSVVLLKKGCEAEQPCLS